MLITSRFVVLNVPKSGSSFVRAALKAVYARRRARAGVGERLRAAAGFGDSDLFLRELMLPNVRLPDRAPDQHGVRAQVPPQYRQLPLVAVARNPWDKLRSEYEYRWWADHPPLPFRALRGGFPRFPDLSFDEFLRLSDLIAERKLGGLNPLGLGNLTVEFVQFFWPDPAAALAGLNDNHVASGAWEHALGDLTLLRQDRLNAELAAFLARHGFGEDEQAMCLAHPRVNETRPGGTRAAWTAWGIEHVRAREGRLFAMLDRLGHRYSPPAVDNGAPATV